MSQNTGHPGDRGDSVTIDCDDCAVRGLGCADCVVSVLSRNDQVNALHSSDHPKVITMADDKKTKTTSNPRRDELSQVPAMY